VGITPRMRSLAGVLALLTLICALAAGPAGAAPLKSDNVRLLGKHPEAAGAIGARFSPDGDTMYVTAATGLFIYDVSEPAVPELLSHLTLPHFENEDVDVGDGVVVISNDPSFSTVGALYVIDVKDPRKPALRSVTPTQLPATPLNELLGVKGTGNGHIANCIQGCRYLWTTGTEEGIAVYDLADKSAPKFLGTFTMPVPKERAGEPTDEPGFTHDVFVDKAGIAWITGEDGTFGYRTTGNPLKPQLVFRSDENVTNTGNSGPGVPGNANESPLDFLHHNSMRTSLTARRKGKARIASSRPGVGGSGDVMAVTEEDYTRPGCDGQGSLQTWQITKGRNSDGTRKLELLDLWTTELNELLSLRGRSPATANCSAHWFDVDRGLVAQGWYDQGVRFLDISNPRKIRQVGYYATAGSFWAAYFAPSDPKRQVVYGIDTAGGIDVLRINRSKKALRTVRAPTKGLAKAPAARYQASKKYGMVCSLPGQQLLRRAGIKN